MNNTQYGITRFKDEKPIVLLQSERELNVFEKIITTALFVLLLACISFAVFFFSHFPFQMIWLILGFIILFLTQHE